LPTLHTVPKPTPLEAFLSKGKEAAAKADADAKAAPPVEAGGEGSDPDTQSEEQGEGGAGWTCPRCGEAFALPDDEWVARQRAEHEDWHFAADLQALYGGSGASTPHANGGGGGSARKGKKAAKPAGIKAFFAPKK
jgi:hypothetical protein